MVKDIAEEVGLLDNLRSVTAAIRRAGIQIFIVRIGAGSPATSKTGITHAGTRSLPARCKRLPKEVRVANGIPASRRNRATSSSKNIGEGVGLRIPILISC
jgi:hypothetical protein